MHTSSPAMHSDSSSAQLGWMVPLISLTTYTLFFIAGYILRMPILNQIGFLVFFYLLLIGNYSRMLRIKRDHTVNVALWITAYMAFHLIFFYKSISLQSFSKMIMIFVLYSMFYSFDFIALPECRERHRFIALTGIIIAGSLLVDRDTINREHGRISGLFMNPNSFALSAFMILFFIDEERDSFRRRLALHLIVFACVTLSATTGAILAYIAGISLKLRGEIRKYLGYRYVPHIISAVVISSLLFIFADISASKSSTLKRIFYQLAIIYNNIEEVIEGRRLNFYYIDSKYGMIVSSGLWRLTNWVRLLKSHLDSSITQIVFGHGAGSTIITLSALPHNDYLRVLYDYGAIGLGAVVYFFAIVFKNARHNYRYIIAIIGFYCITENNMDNMLFMAMFVAFMATIQAGRSPGSYYQPAIPQNGISRQGEQLQIP